MSFAKKIVSSIFKITTNNNQVYCPENCPLTNLGHVSSHRFHCLDNSNEQIAQTLNGLVCLLLDIHSDYEKDVKKKSKKLIDNSLFLNLQHSFEEIKEPLKGLENRLTSITNVLMYSTISEVTNDIISTINRVNREQNTTLVELSSEITGLIKNFKFDPNNPKPVELKTQENSDEILRINKKVIPMIKEASIAIRRSNDLLEQTLDVLTKVKTKLGIDDE